MSGKQFTLQEMEPVELLRKEDQSSRWSQWRGIALAGSCLIASLLAGCSHRDPIDRIIAEESRNEYFRGGLAPAIVLPETATPTQVVSRALEATFSVPAATNFTVTRLRQVSISGRPYSAASVETGLGEKVVLFRFESEGTSACWWTRVYAVQ